MAIEHRDLFIVAMTCVLACGDSATGAEGPAGETEMGVDSGGSEGSATGAVGGGVEVSAPDGSAVLILPEGALPSGIDPADVSVTRSEPADLVEVEDLEQIGGVWTLEPDGLELLQPATLRFIASPEPIVAAHVSPTLGTIELPEIVFEDVDGVRWGSSSLDHFSKYAEIKASAFFGARVITPFADTWVGFKTTSRFGAAVNDAVDVGIRLAAGRLSVSDDPWDFSGELSQFGMTYLPNELPNLPPTTTTSARVAFATATLACAKDGPEETRYSAEGRILVTMTGDEEITQPVNFAVGVSQASRCLPPKADSVDDLFDSGGGIATFVSEVIDIVAYGAGRATVPNDSVVDDLFGPDGTYACGTKTDDFEVVCGPSVEPVAPGEIYVFSVKLRELVSLEDTTRRYQYFAAVDSDGAPENNWQYQDPFVYDTYQDTDTIMVLEGANGVWDFGVLHVDEAQTITEGPSSARAVVFDDSVTFFVSADEMPAANPGFRVGAYGDDGFYTKGDRGADVSGDLPTSLETTYDTLSLSGEV